MSDYVDRNLIRGERVIHRGALSGWAFAGRIALGIVLIPLVVGVLILAGVWIWMSTTELAITNKRVIVKFGWLRVHTFEMNVSKVESIEVEQPFLGRLANFGSVQINGTGSSHAPIHGVVDPFGFRQKFMQAQDDAAHENGDDRAAPAADVLPARG